MKRTFIHPIILFSMILLMIGCKETTTTEPQSNEPTTDRAALELLAIEDSSIISFDTNFDDNGAVILGKTAGDIYPLKVGRRILSITRNFDVNIQGDSAMGTLTINVEGLLIIAASYTPITPGDTTQVDTIISKPFSTAISRNLIFKKIANTPRPKLNWRLAAISLTEGGTASSNIQITELKAFLPSGDTLIINSPNDYYLRRGIGWWKQIPLVGKNQEITIEVRMFSTYSDTDFVTLTYGALPKGFQRAKKKFDLISQFQTTSGYEKLYRQSFVTHQMAGHFHALIDAMPRHVVFDNQTQVEFKNWGLPYFVKP